ncbi:DUF6941 family protein [Streptomyces sp.]|uniref:DUF6941 family protein n=1 Tax=Streptomyces sp. TaxID=1931 RepID=UPI002F940C2E
MASPIDITLILCDAAVADPAGKVHMLGAGWSMTGSPTNNSAIVVLLGVPWDRANLKIPLVLELCDDDGRPVNVRIGEELSAIRHAGEFEVGRPPGVAPGSTLDGAFTLSIPSLPLAPGRYQWRLTISDQIETRSFTVR